MDDQVRETVTTYFLLAWMSDAKGEALARDHYLTKAFRTLVHAGVTLIF